MLDEALATIPNTPLAGDSALYEQALRAAVDAGAEEGAVRAAWTVGKAVPVPVGRIWDVLRVVDTVGRHAVQHLRGRHVPRGPVLYVPARGVYEFLVPRGDECWPPPEAADRRTVERVSRWARRGVMRWPDPRANLYTGRAARCGRTWSVVHRPNAPITTEVEPLWEAISVSLPYRIPE